MHTTSKSPKWSVRLPRDCSISAIRGVYDQIRDGFTRQENLEIDCSGVDKADVTSVQLLVSTAKTANLEGRSVVLTEVSTALRQTFQRAGVGSESLPDQDPQQQNGSN
ncbi:MAG: STAS domain-containing protein [Xanthobacteraceae bacterium]|nr:STAS domain-containing protein [Xanthobacteraceae bacterium]